MKFKEQKDDKTAYTTKDHVITGLWLAYEFLKDDNVSNETNAYRIFTDHLLGNGLKVTECKIPDRFLNQVTGKTK